MPTKVSFFLSFPATIGAGLRPGLPYPSPEPCFPGLESKGKSRPRYGMLQ